MELRVDLSDRADISAAVSLLSTILAATDNFESVSEGISMALPLPPSEALGGVEVPLDGAPSGVAAAALPTVPAGLLAGNQDGVNASSPSVPNVPTPAPVPAAAAAAISPATLDKDGVPWDARIHSNPPSLTQAGVYRKKKGLNDEAYINSVKAELRAVQAIPTPGTVGNVPPAHGAQMSIPAAPSPAAPSATVPPAVASPPATAPAAGAVAQPDPTSFMELMPRITAANSAGILPQSALLDACVAYQLPNIPALAQRADLVPYVWTFLKDAYPALQ